MCEIISLRHLVFVHSYLFLGEWQNIYIADYKLFTQNDDNNTKQCTFVHQCTYSVLSYARIVVMFVVVIFVVVNVVVVMFVVVIFVVVIFVSYLKVYNLILSFLTRPQGNHTCELCSFWFPHQCIFVYDLIMYFYGEK